MEVIGFLGKSIGGILGALAIVLVWLISQRQPIEAVWTEKQQAQYAELLDERLSNLASQVARLAETVEKHVNLEMHPGSAVLFTTIKGDLKHLLEKVESIEAQLKERGD